MKYNASKLLAPLLLAAWTPHALAGALPSPQAAQLLPMAQESTAPDRASEADQLNAAARILESKGYRKEARRLKEIAEELSASDNQRARARLKKAARKLDARAKKLLKRDIDERANRVSMLDLIADGYAAAGDESSAEAMRFFASAGRAQEGGSEMLAMPESLNQGPGTVMDRLVRTVQTGERALSEIGSMKAAEVAKQLGEFYVNRDSGSGAEQEPDEAAPSPRAPQVSDFVTIERRAPVLHLAASAYLSPGSDQAALQRMGWMDALARSRVNPGEVTVPTPPSFGGMTQLIEDIDRAGRIYQRRGSEYEGQLCLTLAEYYRLRDRGEINDDSATRPQQGEVVEEEPAEEPSVEYADLAARRDALEARAAALREEIRRLKQQLAKKKGSDR